MSDHKGARLYLKPEELDKRTGRVRKKATWIIRDGDVRRVTGCAANERVEAERALALYLAEKQQKAPPVEQPASKVLVTEVLRIYAEEVAPKHKRPEKTSQRLLQLGEWWQGKTLADITGRSVRQYTAWRCAMPWKSAKPEKTGNPPRMVTEAGVRRELEDLRAAVNHHRKEGYCREVVEVPLPDRSQPEERWLTVMRWHCCSGRHGGVARFRTASPLQSGLGGTWRASSSLAFIPAHGKRRSPVLL